ncbi:MAG: MFS transporter [Burkholderiaceae bacterium]|jgi:MFS family permease
MTSVVGPLGKPSPHPVVFLVLVTPFGVMSGYLTVALTYLLSKAGLSVEEIASLIFVSFLPQTWKFLWAPVPDTTLSRKTWYLIAAVTSALGIYAMGVVPAMPKYLTVLYAVVFVSNVASTFLAMAVESLIVFSTPPNQHGRAGGWYQAGNLGGGGIGGGLGLWLAQNLAEPWMAGAILAVLCMACAVGLFFVAEPEPADRSQRYVVRLVTLAKDLWTVVRSRLGVLAALICLLPIGSGAASGLWSALADDWHASANTVALVNGVLGGVISAIGCLVGGYISDRIDRKTGYALYGVLQALCAIAMALAPRTEAMFAIFTLLYAFIAGLTYAGFSALVLEAIGLGAAATKYNVLASLANMPIAGMTLVDGWAQNRFGTSGMLYVEAACGVAGILIYLGAAAVRIKRVAVAL